VIGMGAVSLALGSALALGGATSAIAADPEITWDGPTTVTIPYGGYWGFSATATNADFLLGPWEAKVDWTGPGGYEPTYGAFVVEPFTVSAFISPSAEEPVLDVGEYTANLFLVDNASNEYPAPSPVEVTVTPAVLGIEVRIAADPTNSRNAIVSAQFTGEDLGNLMDPFQAAGTPAGTLTIEIRGSDGEVAQTFTVERDDDDRQFASSFYWQDVPGGDFTATGVFSMTGGGAANFDVSDAAPFAFTAAGPEPGSTSTATPAPSAAAAPNGDPTVPLWAPIALGLVSAGLIALIIVQAVRVGRLRRPAAAAGEES